MKKVLTVLTCSILAACSCNETQWEEVDNVVFEDVAYEEPAQVEQSQVIVNPEPVYVPAPQPVQDHPCTEVAPCCQAVSCVPVQPCCCQSMPAPQPKVTTTRKVITTTTTIQEPCGKPVCEPVVTTHEEIIPVDEPVATTTSVVYPSNTVAPQVPTSDHVEVTVQKNPYHSEVVAMKSSPSKVDASAIAKYSPEVYNVVATRAANRMLQDTSAIYDNGTLKTLYIKDAKLLSSDLPYGSHRLKSITKEIVEGSKTFELVNNPKNADFVAQTSADWYVAPNTTIPALQYKLTLLDKNGKKVNEWVEVIRQVQE